MKVLADEGFGGWGCMAVAFSTECAERLLASQIAMSKEPAGLKRT